MYLYTIVNSAAIVRVILLQKAFAFSIPEIKEKNEIENKKKEISSRLQFS